MYICLCNPFSDSTVRSYLSKNPGKTRVADVYTACSGGEKPNCCSCLKDLKSVINDHKGATPAAHPSR